MVKSEMLAPKRIRHWSDGYKIMRVETGIIYDEAVDRYPCKYTYVETDIPKETESETTEEVTYGI